MEAGFQVNYEKSVLVASNVIIHLGYNVINCILFTVSLPGDKVEKICTTCKVVLEKDHVSLRELAGLIGLFTSALRAVRLSGLYYRVAKRENFTFAG